MFACSLFIIRENDLYLSDNTGATRTQRYQRKEKSLFSFFFLVWETKATISFGLTIAIKQP